jgi:hypothetical protein
MQISCSIGAVTYPEHGLVIDELMQQADAAMYVAKKQGGNRLQMGGMSDPACREPTDQPAASDAVLPSMRDPACMNSCSMTA